MAVGTYALTTLAKLRARLNIQSAYTEADTVLESLIDQASAAIESNCNRLFKSRTYTAEVLNGSGSNILLLPQYPVSNIASLVDDSITYVVADYYLYANEGKIVLKYAKFSNTPQAIIVTYTAGYSTIPDDLEMACLILAGNYFRATPLNRELFGDVQDISEQPQYYAFNAEVRYRLNAFRKYDHT